MDRYDEKKDVSDTDEVGAREGDVIGIGGSSVPKMPQDPSASNDPESVRKRRERAMHDDDAGVRHEESGREGSGATGIDMGAGGEGTDISGR